MSYDTSKINEKVNKIKENSEKVYEKGRTKIISSSEYLKEDKQGAIVVVDDMTEIEHKVEVGLSNKNLVDMHNPRVKPTWDAFERIDDNTIRFYGCSGYANAELSYRVYAPVGTKVTISYEDELGGEATGRWYIVQPLGWSFRSGSAPTVPEQGYLDFSFARAGGSGNNKLGWVDIKNLQVEIGETATAYAPYIADFSNCKVRATGKNLLNLEGRTVVNFGGWGDKKRIFPEGKGIILALAGSNYYSGANATGHIYSVGNGNISYDQQGDYYGIGLDLPLTPNTTYKFSYGAMTGGVSLMEFDAEGNFLGGQYFSPVVKTKANTAWGVLLFSDVASVDISVTNPQLEVGTTATEYEPYNEASAEYTANVDGTIEDFNPIFPTMTLSTDTEGTLVNINYIKDLQKTYNNLIINTALSGGE